MSKFLFLYRNDSEKYYTLTPEEMQQMYQKWQAWMADALQRGCLVDAGHGLTQKGCVVNAAKVVSDGPFIEAKNIVGGYSIVQAETLQAAAEVAKGCPILLRGGTVEVRPLWA